MSGHRMNVLVVVTLLACINVVLAASISMGVVSNSETLETLKSDPNDLSTKRFLRSDATSQHLQERALAVSLSGLDTLIASIKSGESNLIRKIRLKWWGMRKKSPDYVFTSLKLDQTGGKLFASPGFSKWVAFVTAHNAKTPEVAVFSTLKSHYSDEALSTMLIAAKEVDGTKDFAAKLQGIQLSTWLTTSQTVDDVYKLLKLDKAGDSIFQRPLFSTWTSYVSMVNKRYPNEVIVAKLSDRYGDVALAKMIAAATKFDGTEKMATDLRTAQFQHWKSQGATPKELDSMLHVRVNSNDAIKKVSADYAKFYGKTKVTSGYDPTWVTTDKSVDEVFKILRLDEAGDKLFESPDLIRWASFVYKVVDKNDADYAMFTKLVDQYGDVALAKMIASAIKVDSTEKLATGLRTELFKIWWLRGATPKEIDSLLHVTANSDDALKKVSVDYEMFYGKIKVEV